MTKGKELKSLIKQTLREFGFKTSKVAVELYGELYYLTEPEIRALQVIAKRLYQESPEAREEFDENVIIYSGRYKTKSHHTLKLCRDGYLDEGFEPGFFNVNANLAHELL